MADDDPTRRADPDDFPTVRGLRVGQKVFGRYVLETELGAGGSSLFHHRHGTPALLGPPGVLVLPFAAIARNARSLRRPSAAHRPVCPFLGAYGSSLLRAAALVARGLGPSEGGRATVVSWQMRDQKHSLDTSQRREPCPSP